MPEVRKPMHQTAIRFDSELWRRIDAESRRIGISASQSGAIRVESQAVWAQARQARGRVRFLREESLRSSRARDQRPVTACRPERAIEEPS